jgi:predicted nucleotidyltransferase
VEDARREYSLNRLAELTTRLAPLTAVLGEQPLCVYATGSYGRLEAGEDSDIDLFFLYDGADLEEEFPFTTFVRVAAAIIDATEEMAFPPFTGDGEYLEVHYVRRMEEVLGSREDDSINAFTARMLLLLESRPVLAPAVYEALLERVVGFYYRDFADHPDEFEPTFLTNDILRFWRTLTLNYEHKRLTLRTLTGDALARKKADSALKNYKLKVSRLLTCFSMVANLAAQAPPVVAQDILTLCAETPRERIRRLAGSGGHSSKLVAALDERYDTFLEAVQRPEAEVLAEFEDGDRRTRALDEAREFGDLIYELIKATADDRRLRYLLI